MFFPKCMHVAESCCLHIPAVLVCLAELLNIFHIVIPDAIKLYPESTDDISTLYFSSQQHYEVEYVSDDTRVPLIPMFNIYKMHKTIYTSISPLSL